MKLDYLLTFMKYLKLKKKHVFSGFHQSFLSNIHFESPYDYTIKAQKFYQDLLRDENKEVKALFEDIANSLIALKNCHILHNKDYTNILKYLIIYTLITLEYTTEDNLMDGKKLTMSKRNIIGIIDNIKSTHDMIYGKYKYKTRDYIKTNMQHVFRKALNG